jgi:hypothetical protein
MKVNIKFSHLLTMMLPATFLLFGSLSCGTDEPPVTPADDTTVVQYPDSLAGTMQFNIYHHVDNEALVFNSKQYVSAAGDTFKVADLRYYISNVKLINTTSGKTYSEKNSYHLIVPKENKTGFKLAGIPVQEFNQIQFSIGVDASANSRTDHQGDLNPDMGMAWDWDTGYKFLAFDGNKISQKAGGSFGLSLHIGNNGNYKTLTFPLNQTLKFQKDKPYTLLTGANLSELFRSPNQIDFDQVYNITDGPNAEKLAQNYGANMFSLISVNQ